MGDDTLKWAAPTAAIIIIALIGGGWRVTRWATRVDGDLKRISEILDTIKEDIDRLLGRSPAQAIESGSPTRLTDFGDRLAAHMDAMQWAAGIAVELAPTLRGQEPYQVDQFAEAYVENSLSEEMKKTVARCAYEFGVGRVQPEAVLRVVLRDALLAAKPDA